MNKLVINDKTYEYPNEVTVGLFQQVISLIKDIDKLVSEKDMTAGKFAGALSNENKLIPLIAMLLNIDEKEAENFPINKAIEVCNNFFYSNGFWLMISNHFSMPSEVKEMLTSQDGNLTRSANSENSKKPISQEAE
tara:strand:+ start:719 stop:1126 length:408 start_codon:yes stop_codon:yes gene_type:complete